MLSLGHHGGGVRIQSLEEIEAQYRCQNVFYKPGQAILPAGVYFFGDPLMILGNPGDYGPILSHMNKLNEWLDSNLQKHYSAAGKTPTFQRVKMPTNEYYANICPQKGFPYECSHKIHPAFTGFRVGSGWFAAINVDRRPSMKEDREISIPVNLQQCMISCCGPGIVCRFTDEITFSFDDEGLFNVTSGKFHLKVDTQETAEMRAYAARIRGDPEQDLTE